MSEHKGERTMSHKTEAVRLDKLSSVQPDADSANSLALSGLLHATLAVAEQLRISNLIALASLDDSDVFYADVPEIKLQARYEGLLERREVPAVPSYGPDGIAEQWVINPEIAAALGIGEKNAS